MKKALIVVDYQNDFVIGSLGFAGAERLDAVICGKIRECRADGGAVIFTMDTHGASYAETREGRNLRMPHCIRGTDGYRLYGECAKLKTDGDLVFEKPTFGSMELARYLEKSDFAQIELCGLAANICVLSNAVLARAALPEAEIIVDAAATASADADLTRKAFDIMEGLQISVINRRRKAE
ncbi:MAG: cysteine hydrolase [Firmicutes bacterium]|nr:cysteine hydrolase [Bacillota bacterium]